jgi:hypothetical protein
MYRCEHKRLVCSLVNKERNDNYYKAGQNSSFHEHAA